jgi:hypothetical protein
MLTADAAAFREEAAAFFDAAFLGKPGAGHAGQENIGEGEKIRAAGEKKKRPRIPPQGSEQVRILQRHSPFFAHLRFLLDLIMKIS